MRVTVTILLLATLWVLLPKVNYGMGILDQEAKCFVKSGLQGTSTYLNKKSEITTKQNSPEQFSTSHSLINSFYILTSTHFSSGSRIDTRNFVDAFFISFIDYWVTLHRFKRHNSTVDEIAIQHKLMLIYPYHSFW